MRSYQPTWTPLFFRKPGVSPSHSPGLAQALVESGMFPSPRCGLGLRTLPPPQAGSHSHSQSPQRPLTTLPDSSPSSRLLPGRSSRKIHLRMWAERKPGDPPPSPTSPVCATLLTGNLCCGLLRAAPGTGHLPTGSGLTCLGACIGRRKVSAGVCPQPSRWGDRAAAPHEPTGGLAESATCRTGSGSAAAGSSEGPSTSGLGRLPGTLPWCRGAEA